MKCYAVVSGEYSDWQVHAIYAKREDAVAEVLRVRLERIEKGLDPDAYSAKRSIEEFPFYPGDTPIRPIQ